MSDDMAEKKPRGRPMKKGYPPRIDATPEEIARAVLKGGRPTGRVKSRDYRCGACGRSTTRRRCTTTGDAPNVIGARNSPSAKIHYNSPRNSSAMSS